MYTLFHHPFCPHSRFIRLALGEHGIDVRLTEERAWERREGFLLLNPAGTTPVLMAEGFPPASSPNISTRLTASRRASGGCCRSRWPSASRCAG
jgi:glutathione S-transferase